MFLAHGRCTIQSKFLNCRQLSGPHSLQDSLTDPPMWKVTSCNGLLACLNIHWLHDAQIWGHTLERWLMDTEFLWQMKYNFWLAEAMDYSSIHHIFTILVCTATFLYPFPCYCVSLCNSYWKYHQHYCMYFSHVHYVTDFVYIYHCQVL